MSRDPDPMFVSSAGGTPPVLAPSRRALALSIAGALLVSAAGVWASAQFVRKAPASPPEQHGLKVENQSIAIAPDAPHWQVLELETAKAIDKSWGDPVTAYVKVDETKASRIGVPLAGRVTQVLAELGQEVAAKTPLFAVASPDLATLHVEQSKAAVDLAVSRNALERVKAIVEARAVPEKEAIAAEQQLRQAELSYGVAQSKINSLNVAPRSDNEFVVLSPRAGRVVEKNVLPGQVLGAGTDANLMMVADISSVWIVADLFESDSAGIVRGTMARITVSALPGATFEGEVEMVSAVVDPERHTVPVRVRLDNKDGRLKPNTYAKVQFLESAPPGSVEIAASAIVSDGSRQYVYVRDASGRFARRTVVAGSSREGRIIVVQGIAPGDTVVSKGAILLDNQIDLTN
jgi:membrane fusion protein, heavy metal efflux system